MPFRNRYRRCLDCGQWLWAGVAVGSQGLCPAAEPCPCPHTGRGSSVSPGVEPSLPFLILLIANAYIMFVKAIEVKFSAIKL